VQDAVQSNTFSTNRIQSAQSNRPIYPTTCHSIPAYSKPIHTPIPARSNHVVFQRGSARLIWHTTIPEPCLFAYKMCIQSDNDVASGTTTCGVVEFLGAEWGCRPSGIMSARANCTNEEGTQADVALLNYVIQFESSQRPGTSRSTMVHLEFASSQMLSCTSRPGIYIIQLHVA
jgi:hypothetical protein